MMHLAARIGTAALVALVLVLVVGPIVVVGIIAFSDAESFRFPPTSFSLRWFTRFFESSNLTSALWLSLRTAFVAATLATAIALSGAFAAIRLRGKATVAYQAVFLAPLVFPTIVLGLALLLFYRSVGIDLYLGLVLAHVTVGAPYAFRTILTSLSSYDPTLTEAARCLRAGPLRSFLLVTLPIIWPGIFSGWLFAFIISLGELNTSLFLTGPGTTTLPIEIFGYLQFEGGQLVIAAASALQVAIIVVLFAMIQYLKGATRA